MLPNLYIYLEAQEEINFNNISIYQTSLKDMLKYDIDKYNMLLLPFLLDIDDFDIPSEILAQGINVFDILTYDERTFKMLLDSISFFCKADKISFDEEKRVFYINEGFVDRNNFEDFSNIILAINSKKKIKREKPPKNMTTKQQEVWKKLQEGRQRAEKKAQIELYDLINTCQFGGDYYIPMHDILQWTLWNIARCYNTILGKSTFQESFEIYCVTGEDKLIQNRHWTDLIKLNKNKEEITI